MKVVILCGGRGTRLKEETEFRPKPLVRIGNKPVLWHIMKIYAHYGFKDFILCNSFTKNNKVVINEEKDRRPHDDGCVFLINNSNLNSSNRFHSDSKRFGG